MLASLLLAAAAEGVGLSTLVPVLGLAFQQAGAPSHAPTGFEADGVGELRRVGIEPTLGSLVRGGGRARSGSRARWSCSRSARWVTRSPGRPPICA